MKAKDIMSKDVRTCAPTTTLACAAELMLDADCGFLPVVDDGKLVGVVTDRDMYIALATRNKRAAEITVGEVARPDVFTCGPEDDVAAVLAAMRQHRVRRIPVAGFEGRVLGVLDMNDVVRAAGRSPEIRTDQVVDTLQAICAHRHATPHVTAA
jgi:CBS domain-containing protein